MTENLELELPDTAQPREPYWTHLDAGLVVVDAECYEGLMRADEARIKELECENRALRAEIEQLNRALDRALPTTPHSITPSQQE